MLKNLVKILIILMPFYVLLKVFFEVKLGVPLFGFFIKEFLLILIWLALVYEYFKSKKLPKFDLLDYLIFAFISYGVFITILNGLGLSNIVWWWRYDFLFFWVFLIFKHSYVFLKDEIKNFLKLFLLSWWFAIILWIIIKVILGEEFLLNFWYILYNPSWVFEWWIPIYHWLEASWWIRRFQWIFDWPNQAAYFLIVFLGLFYAYYKKITPYTISIWIIILVILFLTYSRSAVLGVLLALWLLSLVFIKTIYLKYKKYTLISLWITLLFLSSFFIIYKDNISNIILRWDSTRAHFERMWVWLERFLEKPFGHWLATSGPGFRNVYKWEITKEKEYYFIPESYYIQILVEWWIIFFALFVTILFLILYKTFFVNLWLSFALAWVYVMNIFLHSFETSYASIILFLFVWLMITKNWNEKNNILK